MTLDWSQTIAISLLRSTTVLGITGDNYQVTSITESALSTIKMQVHDIDQLEKPWATGREASEWDIGFNSSRQFSSIPSRDNARSRIGSTSCTTCSCRR